MQVRHHRRSTRSGFTLLEVLLAAALCAVLIGASFQAVHLTWHYRRATETGQQSSRIRFGLIEDLACDLRGTVPPHVPEEPEDRVPTRSNTRGFLPQSDFSEKMLSVDQTTLLRPTHLVGSARSLLLLRQSASPRFPGGGGGASPQAGTPLHQVLWWTVADGPPRVHWAMSGQQRRVRAPAIGRGQVGLLRTEWPFEPALAATRPAAQLAVAVEPSISSLRFRYFDGTEWRSDWNSYDEKSLPAAVEVTLVSSDGAEPPLRSVVHLPQSRPPSGPSATPSASTTLSRRGN